MVNLTNVWNSLVDWFKERRDRMDVVREFNASAKDSFVCGLVPVLLRAKISKGDPNYRHSFSWRGASGFRIEALTGHSLSKKDVTSIGEVILANGTLVRKLVANGWDTLEVHGDVDAFGCKWRLREFIAIGG